MEFELNESVKRNLGAEKSELHKAESETVILRWRVVWLLKRGLAGERLFIWYLESRSVEDVNKPGVSSRQNLVRSRG